MKSLHKYKCHKEVHARPMSRGDYNEYRGWALPKGEKAEDPGYLVVYGLGTSDEYESWSPKKQFDEGYDAISGKTLHNSDVSGARKNVSDLQVFGNGDSFELICKASSVSEGWMKSTKAMEIGNVGCVVQVTTQQGDNVAEALTFVPGVGIYVDEDGNKYLRRFKHPSLGV